ncbi:hypothetical protein [Cuspidothrix issatschenkoi]|uniref:Uncharacterized protein n=1 Tax=Cuspidothrix issatschenkoi CHARLIE-1 TaxID=2052836 RepID=A0A2S6CX30_9CYAN|nr:hypothetical protein [Cuspidothrix issatschenkoi]PPJ64140.1 hypothetical protein CUN59_06115 [Cuspidothrix issatschenkoi CHARLIE-1]TRT79175.1 MAG: hypothetical protein EWV82_16635 [Microcystis aeruginosa Ma_AC_P_19900807_S299]
MSLIKLLQTLISGTHNPELDAARINHDSLPQSEYFQGEKLSKDQLERDKQITSQRGYQLGRSLRAAIEEHYSAPEQQRVIDSLMKAIVYLGNNARIFPDMDYKDIWYTDYYDLIELAKDMGLGDRTLPHWPEESNSFNRYLELTTSDLVQIFLGFLEEALLDEYKFGADLDSWVRYLLRETLKSRQRLAREQQKQDEALRFSPTIFKTTQQNKSNNSK